MILSANITDEKKAKLLNALNYFFDKEYGNEYNTLDEIIDADGLIGVAYTEYEGEEYEYYGCYTLQVSYDLATEEYVYIYDDENGRHEKREGMEIDYFIKDLNVCYFEDFLNFDKD